MKHLYILFGILFLGLSQFNLSAQTNHYVDQNATGSNNGSSWINAYVDLQSALTTCSAGDNILVAEGIYYPTATTNRGISFVLVDSVVYLGGYPTGGGIRDWENNITVLSGDIGAQNDDSDNSYSVVKLVYCNSKPEINGFTIKKGKASQSYNFYGGGVNIYQSNPKFINCKIVNNYANYEGGGVYNERSNSIFENCIFQDNRAFIYSYVGKGAALYNKESTPKIINCQFINNSCNTGCAIYNEESPADIINCIFYNNNATSRGGAVYNEKSSTEIINCSFYKNKAGANGGGVYNNLSPYVRISNSVFWENSVSGEYYVTGADIQDINCSINVSYCITQLNSIYSNGLGIINHQDPIFIDESIGDLRIQACSPAINSGNNSVFPGYVFGDIDYNARIYNGIIDMGVNEIDQNQTNVYHYNLYVDSSASVGGNGMSWNTAFTDLNNALAIAAVVDNCSIADTIFVAEGTYFPTATIDRSISFEVIENTIIIGGYNAATGQRDIDAYPTTLSGDIGQLNDSTDNSWHIIKTFGTSLNTLVDGITFKDAYAYGTEVLGGAIENRYSAITIQNCKFINNTAAQGGGAIDNNVATAIIVNSHFENNNTVYDFIGGGGAISNFESSVKIINCSFSSNISYDGGAIYNYDADVDIINCFFIENKANYGSSSSGGAIKNINGEVNVLNCSFYSNSARRYAGAIDNYSQYMSKVKIANCVFWGNGMRFIPNDTLLGSDIYSSVSSGNILPEVTYCLTQLNSVYSTGVGIINNQYPMFMNVYNNDLRLTTCSPAIDAGNNAVVDSLGFYDFDGNNRIYNNGTVDMGAFEFQGNGATYIDVFDSICANSSYVLPDGLIVNTPGIYTSNFQSANGCDSIITTHLGIFVTDYIYYDTICDNEQYLLPDGTLTNISGVYIDSLINSGGCDSIITTNLVVYTVSILSSLIYDTICINDSYILPSGIIVNMPGIYYDTILNNRGCDSGLIVDLFMKPISTKNIYDTICESETYRLPNGLYTNIPGLYTDTNINSFGCDSIVYYNLTILQENFYANDTICVNETYSLPDGSIISSPGIYYTSFVSTNVCDSVIVTNLSVVSIDTSVTVSIDTLFANQTNAIYQWYNCTNNTIITNETSNMFIPIANGSYAVIIEVNNCLDTSNCHAISIIGIAETDFSDKLSIYPNPTDDKISIDLSNKYNDINIKVFSQQGQLLINKGFNVKQIIEIDLSDIPTGVLYISITADNKNGNVKVVKM